MKVPPSWNLQELQIRGVCNVYDRNLQFWGFAKGGIFSTELHSEN